MVSLTYRLAAVFMAVDMLGRLNAVMGEGKAVRIIVVNCLAMQTGWTWS